MTEEFTLPQFIIFSFLPSHSVSTCWIGMTCKLTLSLLPRPLYCPCTATRHPFSKRIPLFFPLVWEREALSEHLHWEIVCDCVKCRQEHCSPTVALKFLSSKYDIHTHIETVSLTHQGDRGLLFVCVSSCISSRNPQANETDTPTPLMAVLCLGFPVNVPLLSHRTAFWLTRHY